jgi:hypothetical protein
MEVEVCPALKNIAVMRHSGSAVDQAITKGLINRDCAFGSIEADRPRGGQVGLGRKIQAQRNAELALLPVGVLLQFGAAQIRRQIDIRGLDSLSRDGAHRLRNLMMEESCDALVVGDVSP